MRAGWLSWCYARDSESAKCVALPPWPFLGAFFIAASRSGDATGRPYCLVFLYLSGRRCFILYNDFALVVCNKLILYTIVIVFLHSFVCTPFAPSDLPYSRRGLPTPSTSSLSYT